MSVEINSGGIMTFVHAKKIAPRL